MHEVQKITVTQSSLVLQIDTFNKGAPSADRAGTSSGNVRLTHTNALVHMATARVSPELTLATEDMEPAAVQLEANEPREAIGPEQQALQHLLEWAHGAY